MQMQKKWLWATLVISLLATNATAEEKNAPDVLLGLLEKIQTFKAHFNQQIRITKESGCH